MDLCLLSAAGVLKYIKSQNTETDIFLMTSFCHETVLISIIGMLDVDGTNRPSSGTKCNTKSMAAYIMKKNQTANCTN